MIRLLAVLAVALAMLAVGCGSDSGDSGDERETAAERVFGDLSDADVERLRSLSPTMREIGVLWADLVGDFNDLDLRGARRKVDRLGATVGGVRREIEAFEDPELQTAVRDYVRPMGEFATAAERFVSEAEKETETCVPTKPALVEEMVTDMESAQQRALVAEERFRTRMLAVVSPEQREEAEARIREIREQLKARSRGDSGAP